MTQVEARNLRHCVGISQHLRELQGVDFGFIGSFETLDLLPAAQRHGHKEGGMGEGVLWTFRS